MSSLEPIYYTGVGSRKTPASICARMTAAAGRLAALGYVLRSGAADGADAAFEKGCDAARGRKEIWLPWPGFNRYAGRHVDYPTQAHARAAATTHAAWAKLNEGDRRLHSRDVGQVLGRELDAPSRFLLCWTPDGCESGETRSRDTGGTATAIVIASQHGIPVFNLANEGTWDRFASWMLAQQRAFHPDGSLPQGGEVFVFGSNLAGRHGKGAAQVARDQFGASSNVPHGRFGQSYAIPTKDGRPLPGNPRPPLEDPVQTLPLDQIAAAIDKFVEYARLHLNEQFFVTRIGCGLAGYGDREIAPLFARAPANCSLPAPWIEWIGEAALARREPAAQPAESTDSAPLPAAQADLFGG